MILYDSALPPPFYTQNWSKRPKQTFSGWNGLLGLDTVYMDIKQKNTVHLAKMDIWPRKIKTKRYQSPKISFWLFKLSFYSKQICPTYKFNLTSISQNFWVFDGHQQYQIWKKKKMSRLSHYIQPWLLFHHSTFHSCNFNFHCIQLLHHEHTWLIYS